MFLNLVLVFCAAVAISNTTFAAADVKVESKSNSTTQVPDSASGISRSNHAVTVPHETADREIVARLQRIFVATGWFKSPVVESREGIVTLKGQVQQKSQREWAESLTRDTEGVIAVINSIEVPAGQWFDIRPAEQETRSLIKKFFSFTPYILASILVLLIVAGFSIVATRVGRKFAVQKFHNALMIELVAKLFALPVIVLGLYLVLKISGLTGMAVTVLGGTGALGLVAGFAMKNILENYFSGVMLSISNPYSVGDVITVNGKRGVVRTLTTRGTVLIDFDGNHIIIPNSTIYGTTVVNETANPSVRVKFSLRLGYDVSPKKARELILSAIKETTDVLGKPESLVLLSDFEATNIVYDVTFWIDTKKSSGAKMKSVVMERIRAKFCEAQIKISGDVQKISIVKEPEQPPSQKAEGSVAPGKDTTVADTETSIESDGLLDEARKGRDIDHGGKLL